MELQLIRYRIVIKLNNVARLAAQLLSDKYRENWNQMILLTL